MMTVFHVDVERAVEPGQQGQPLLGESSTYTESFEP